jgi:hypothetical protein
LHAHNFFRTRIEIIACTWGLIFVIITLHIRWLGKDMVICFSNSRPWLTISRPWVSKSRPWDSKSRSWVSKSRPWDSKSRPWVRKKYYHVLSQPPYDVAVIQQLYMALSGNVRCVE